MDIGAIKHLLDTIDGWLTDSESELLYQLAKQCTGRGVIVEIGSWKGRSAICLGSGSRAGNNVQVYAIDPHIGSSEHREANDNIWTFEEFQQNIRKAAVDTIVTPILKTSEQAAKEFDQPIELIFIDGAHEYNLVKLDLDLWFPKVIDGGIMVFHDTAYRTSKWPGPKQVVEAFVYPSPRFKNIRLVDSITMAEKVRRNSLRDRIANRYALLLKYIYENDIEHKLREMIDRLHIPKPMRIVGKKLVGFLFLW